MAWIRVRKSRLLAADDVTQVGIQKNGEQDITEFTIRKYDTDESNP
jgi:hypothetical protein